VTRVRRDESGVAALEFALLMSLLMLVAFGALPLYSMARSYQRVSKASAATLRYASAVASNGKRDSSGELTRRPSYDEIARFARDAAGDESLAVVVTVCKGPACTDIDGTSPTHASPIPAVAGDTVRLKVSTTVDLRLVGSVANAASRLTGNGPAFPEGDVTVTSTASAREE
jgi:Flp pilus assembly protein TadG